MTYYILSQDVENDEEDAMLAGHSEYLDRIRVPFDAGDSLPLEDILVPIEIFVEEASLRGKMKDHLILDDVDCNIITKKAKQFLEKINITNFQTLPITLIDSYSNADAVEEAKLKDEKLDYKEVIYNEYEIFNTTGLIDCINHKDSNLEYFSSPTQISDDMPPEMKAMIEEESEEDNDIDFIRKLVLDNSKIPEDLKIFRLKDCPRILVFKEEIVQAIREAKLTGFVFTPLSEYTDEIPDDDDDDDETTEKTQETKKENTIIDQKKEEPESEEEEIETPKTRGKIIIKSIRKN